MSSSVPEGFHTFTLTTFYSPEQGYRFSLRVWPPGRNPRLSDRGYKHVSGRLSVPGGQASTTQLIAVLEALIEQL